MSELREHVANVCRDMTAENFAKFNNDVNKKIFELIHSPDNYEKVGGIMAIGIMKT